MSTFGSFDWPGLPFALDKIHRADVLVYLKDLERRYLYANASAKTFIGVSPRSLLGKHNREILQNENLLALIEQAELEAIQRREHVLVCEWPEDAFRAVQEQANRPAAAGVQAPPGQTAHRRRKTDLDRPGQEPAGARTSTGLASTEPLRPDHESAQNTDLIEDSAARALPADVVEPEDPDREANENSSFLLIVVPLLTPAGQPELIAAVLTHAPERCLSAASMRQASAHDPLTRLPHRRLLHSHLERVLSIVQSGVSSSALLVVNLDNFRRLNDAGGLDLGDQALREVALRLLGNTRTHDFVARGQGDEFFVLINQLSGERDVVARTAMRIAEKLRRRLADQALLLDGEPCLLSASIGITLLDTHSGSARQMLREANMALHRAKKEGGNRTVFYETRIQADVEQHLWLEQGLARALHSPQLSMHLQPQYDVDEHICGAELLIRWNHPSRGQIPPGEFIHVAEQTSLIRQLSLWTLEAACQMIKRLERVEATYPVALNISPGLLMDQEFIRRARQTLEMQKVSGERLIFEVTEQILVEDFATLTQNMQQLRALGIRFSLDDFGTGYANLVYLQRLPLHQLKIDRSLVQETPQNPDSAAICRLILVMARQLGLHVVAEGVETREQARFLLEEGCPAQQGYWYAHPMPIDTWISQQAAARLVQKISSRQ